MQSRLTWMIVVCALALLPREMRARVLVVGGESPDPDPKLTPEIGRLQALADALGVGDRVTFTGQRRRQDLPDCYGAADVFVTTPWYEPFGITPLEAMACGTPVVASAVGGIKHSVVDGVTGPGDLGDLHAGAPGRRGHHRSQVVGPDPTGAGRLEQGAARGQEADGRPGQAVVGLQRPGHLRPAGGQRRRVDHDEVEALIVKGSGTHFDPAVVEAFVTVSPMLRSLSESDDLSGQHRAARHARD